MDVVVGNVVENLLPAPRNGRVKYAAVTTSLSENNLTLMETDV